MRKLLVACLYITLIAGFSACKKDNTTNSGVTDYIQFKIDGQLVRIENCPADVQNLGLGWHPSELQYHSADSTYSFIAYVASCNSNEPMANIALSYIPLEVTNYADRGAFRYDMSSGKRYYANTSLSTVSGNINFTQVERKLGGIVKGTFNFTNVTYYDGSTTTDGHNITEGEFMVVIGQY